MSSSLAIAVPKAPLGQTVNGVCSLIRNYPERRVELCGKLKAFISENSYTAVQLASHLRATYDEKAAQDWIDWFVEFEVFPPDASGPVIAQPGKQTERTELQDPQTVLQPEKITKASLPVPTVAPDSIAESGAVKALAAGLHSVLIVGREDLLSADLLRALAKESMAVCRQTELKIIDLAAYPWLGLQCDSNIVAYVTRGVEEDMIAACEAVKAVWQGYQKNTELVKQAMRRYQQPPTSHPIRLIVTGWSLFYSWAKTYSGAQLADYFSLAKSKSVSKPLAPMQAVACVGHMIAGGSSGNVACYLAAQETSAAATGFSPDVLQVAELAAIGRNCDYAAVMTLAQRCSSSFAQQAQQAANASKPVFGITQGGGRLVEVADYSVELQSSLRRVTAVQFYRDPVIKSLGR